MSGGDGELRGARLTIVLVLAMAGPWRAGAQGGTGEPPCTRVTLDAWSPALDWSRAGHQDSTGGVAAAVRRARDSVFASSGGVGTRDGMHWLDVDGERRLFLYPGWWPAGIMIRFTGKSLGDTLVGEAQALVADLGAPVSRARARVVTRCESKD